jgi:DNA polymerase phi
LDGKLDGSSTASPGEGSAVAIRELAHLAFPTAQPKPGSKAESAIKMIRERLLTLFAKKARQSQEHDILIDLVLAIEDSALAHLPHDLQEEATEAMQRIKTARYHGGLVKSTTHSTLQAGTVLLDAAALLQLYNEEEDAVVTLRDLKACHAIMQESDTSVEGSASQAEVLVEVILAMLARPSPLMRQVTLQAFESLTETMTPEAIQLLTDVLAVAENENGQRAIFKLGEGDDDESMADDDDADDDMVDEEHEADDDDDIEEDIVLNGIELINGQEASGDEDEDEDAEEDGSDAEEAPKDLQDLDNELEKILGSHRLDKDADAASSSGESDMTDSEMMALDETLAQAFKSRVKHHRQKKQKVDAKETVINFKHRVLDLLAVFLRKEAGTNVLSFEVLVPLLELIRTTTAKPLAQKAAEAITDFGKSLKRLRSRGEDSAKPVDATALLTLLGEIHREASRDPSHAFARAVSSASLAVAAHLFYIDESNLDEIFAIYGKTLKEWALGKIRLQASFSLDWHNWLAGHAATAHSAVKIDTDM